MHTGTNIPRYGALLTIFRVKAHFQQYIADFGSTSQKCFQIFHHFNNILHVCIFSEMLSHLHGTVSNFFARFLTVPAIFQDFYILAISSDFRTHIIFPDFDASGSNHSYNYTRTFQEISQILEPTGNLVKFRTSLQAVLLDFALSRQYVRITHPAVSVILLTFAPSRLYSQTSYPSCTISRPGRGGGEWEGGSHFNICIATRRKIIE